MKIIETIENEYIHLGDDGWINGLTILELQRQSGENNYQLFHYPLQRGVSRTVFYRPDFSNISAVYCALIILM
jgi:hypothetical protein